MIQGISDASGNFSFREFLIQGISHSREFLPLRVREFLIQGISPSGQGISHPSGQGISDSREFLIQGISDSGNF